MSARRHTEDTVKDTLKNLIEQFSDVYCFYRELIQNSLDAGTNRIDVHLEYIKPAPGKSEGVIKIHVDDYGEGMNRSIIDNELTRLFSSSKENDLTKIGKFGIGFVSVFAIKPEAVIVDTSRDGEDWRIIFTKNMDFERIKRDYPVDGTKITILKKGNKKFFDNFLSKSKDTVVFWCKHSEAEIYFQDEKINQPFDVASDLKIHETTPAAEVVAGYCNEEAPLFGFYNQGLTLMEGSKKFFPRVAFKVKSKYLEHTLTRDNIREDEHYWKAMESLDKIVKTKLPTKLFTLIQEELQNNGKETDKYQSLLGYALRYLIFPEEMPRPCRDMKIARDVDGNFLTVNQLLKLKEQGILYWDKRPNEITNALKDEKKTVLRAAGNTRMFMVINRLSEKFWNKKNVSQASQAFFKPRVIDPSNLSPVEKRLAASVDYINRKMSTKTGPCAFAEFNYKDSNISDRIYVMQAKPGGLSPVEELDERGAVTASLFSLFAKTKTLVLNRNHPYIKNLIQLGETEPDLTAYFLSKLLYMDDGVHTEVDTKLASIAMEKSGV